MQAVLDLVHIHLYSRSRMYMHALAMYLALSLTQCSNCETDAPGPVSHSSVSKNTESVRCCSVQSANNIDIGSVVADIYHPFRSSTSWDDKEFVTEDDSSTRIVQREVPNSFYRRCVDCTHVEISRGSSRSCVWKQINISIKELSYVNNYPQFVPILRLSKLK